MTNNNSIEHNLTNQLFANCRKRFIIDINDNDDVQITSCIASNRDQNCLVHLSDGHCAKEVKYRVDRGKENRVQFRTYSLDDEASQLKEAIVSLLDDEMNVQFERQTNFINHPAHFNQETLNERLTRSGRKFQEESDDPAPAKRGRPTTKKAVGKSKVKKAKTNKRAQSEDAEQRNIKRRKVADKQESTAKRKAAVTNARAKSKSRTTSRSRNNSKARKTKPTQAKQVKVSPKKVNTKSIELIKLESSVDSEESVVECPSSSQGEMSQDMIRTAVGQIADYLLAKENRASEPETSEQRPNENSQQVTRSPVQLITTNSSETGLTKRLSSAATSVNQSMTQSPSQRSSQGTIQHASRPSFQHSATLLKKKLVDFGALEKRIAKMRELKEASDGKGKQFKLINKLAQQSKADESIYQLNDSLISVDYKLGRNHLIICLTIILIGELVHYLQPRSTLNYDQLPIGCLLISNLLNLIQFTFFGSLAYKFVNPLAPNFFNTFPTSSRLICYSNLLFLSYGMLRKSLTNWALNNQSAIALFPFNVAMCSLMLLVYSLVALCLSTDGNRLIRKSQNEQANEMVEGKLESLKDWFYSTVTILIPFAMISPILGSNSCRLYAVPKPVLLISSSIYLIGLYKYVVCRLERMSLNRQNKLLVYELKSNLYLISNSSSRIRFLTFFGALLIITAYNLLVLNLWALLLELFTLIYLKMKSNHLDHLFTRINKPIYTKYKNNKPYMFIPYLH